MSNIATLPVIPQSVPTHDNTMMNDYAYCQRWYAIRHRRQMGRVGRGTNATDYGSLWHAGMDAYYTAIKEGKELPHVVHAALEAIKNYPFEDPVDDYRTRGRALHDIVEYAAQYGIDKDWQVIFTETAFEVADEEGYRYGGKIDLAVRYAGRVWTPDHKTASRVDKWYFDNYKLSPQMMGYTWGGQQLRGGEPVEGVIINLAHVLKNKTEFHRRPIRFSPAHIAHWRARNIYRYHELAAKIEQDPNNDRTFDVSVWTPNLENCIGKYGPCGAYPVCSSLPQNYEKVLGMYFQEDVWDWRETIEED